MTCLQKTWSNTENFAQNKPVSGKRNKKNPFILKKLTCEPDGAAPEAAEVSKDLSSFVPRDMVLLFGHVCGHLQSLFKKMSVKL